MSLAKLLSILTTFVVYNGASALQIFVINVPAVADTRHPTRLFCSYDTAPLAFFSVKWYLDDREFFRYMPNHEPNFLVFPMPDFEIQEPDRDQCDTKRCGISLTVKSFNASGTYSCEVSSEAPTFRTVIEARNMTVMTLPKDKPRIEGVKSTYDIGEDLIIKCTSSPSVPHATLTLQVNELEVHESDINTWIYQTDNGFVTTVDLTMKILRKHFLGALLRVKCIAVISQTPATSLVAEVTATLAVPQTLHIQKLEWPNSSGKTSFSFCLLLSTILIWISLIKYR